MRRRQIDLEVLRARCEAAAGMVDAYAAARADASARLLAAPHDREAFAALETAEQLHYLAVHELRRVRRALRRREALDHFLARVVAAPVPRRR